MPHPTRGGSEEERDRIARLAKRFFHLTGEEQRAMMDRLNDEDRKAVLGSIGQIGAAAKEQLELEGKKAQVRASAQRLLDAEMQRLGARSLNDLTDEQAIEIARKITADGGES